MSAKSRTSIRRKLGIMVVWTSGLALLAVGGAYLCYHHFCLGRQIITDLIGQPVIKQNIVVFGALVILGVGVVVLRSTWARRKNGRYGSLCRI